MASPIALILNNLDQVAIVTGGLFAGTAFHMSFTEHPALSKVGTDEHWRYFGFMFETARIQGIFAILTAATSITYGTRIVGSPFDRNLWLLAGALFGSIGPYTAVLIAPTLKLIVNDNKRIQAGNPSQFDSVAKKNYMDKWTTVHFGRTIISIAGIAIMAYGLTRHSLLTLGW